MSTSGRIDLDCGIPYDRIASWLETELALACEAGTWTFHSGSQTCLIAIEPLQPRRLGPVAIERTRLSIEGEPGARDEFQRLFTLRFASAGG